MAEEILVFYVVPSSVVTANLIVPGGKNVFAQYAIACTWCSSGDKLVMTRLAPILLSRRADRHPCLATDVDGWEDVTAEDHKVFRTENRFR